MKRSTVRVMTRCCLAVVAAMAISACSDIEELIPALERLTDRITDEEGQLSDEILDGVSEAIGRASGGSTDVTIRAEVAASYHLADQDYPLYGWEATIDHEVIGLFAGDGSWHVPRVSATGTGEGYEICYPADGGTREHFWASELHWPGLEPQIELEVQGDEVAVLYALDWEVGFDHPGAPPCEPAGETPPGPAVTHYAMHVLEGERSPNASGSSRVGIYDGIVVMRVPLDELTAGGTWRADHSTSGEQDGESATLDLQIELTAG